MIAYEASLTYQTINFAAADRLATTKQLLAYFTAGIPDAKTESFWIVCMNANRRPICRSRLKTGVLVAAQVSVREVFLTVLLAEAKEFACLRPQSEGAIRPSLADGRLLWNLREAARLMNIEFVDYLITKIDGRGCYSWREREKRSG